MPPTPPTPQPAPQAAPKDGPWLQHDEAGTLRTSATLQQGILHGPLSLFDEHGRPVLEDHYTHGKLEGTRRICADGNLHTIAHYRNGLQQGETHLHHPNGILAATLPFRDGKLHGQASYFGQDGKLARKATYQAGKLHGKTISYYPDGAILSTEPYANDLLEGESKWLSPQGDVVKRTLFLQGKPASPTPATSQPKASTAPKRTLAIKPR